jgi:ABC-2 type transport system permease protein
MKQYLSLFRIRFTYSLQYRAAAYAGVATQFFWGFMELLLFRAFYRSGSSDFPMEFSQLASYIWLQQSFLALFMLWFYDSEIFQSITSGNVAYELARPMDLYSMWFTKNIATRLSRAVLRCIPILLVAALLPKPYGISLPYDIVSFMMFVVTAVLAFFTVVAFCMLVYISTFYTLSSLGVRIVAASLTEFLAGGIIPLPFLPGSIQRVIGLTPFASMQNLPFRIYSGNIAGTEMIKGVVLQIFWLVALVLIGKLWMNRALKRVVIQGG